MNTHELNINPENLLRIPGKVWIYWKNTEGTYLGCNDLMAEELRFSSRHDIVGRTDFDLNLQKDEAEFYRSIDQQIITTGMTKEIKDSATTSNSKLEFLVLKTPLCEANNTIVGLVGFSYYLNKESLNSSSITIINGVALNSRSVQILQLLVRGKIAKQIAAELGLSVRTVEHYLVGIRRKFNVFSKADLIEKVIDYIL